MKTAQDVKMRAKSDRIRKKHLGIKPPSRWPTARNGKFKQKLSGEIVPR